MAATGTWGPRRPTPSSVLARSLAVPGPASAQGLAMVMAPESDSGGERADSAMRDQKGRLMSKEAARDGAESVFKS